MIYPYSGTESSSPPPNIVFIMGDDWGWGDLSMNGHKTIKTPRIDKLARDGMVFDNFRTNSPVCGPSRVSMLTGRFPAELGVYYNYHPDYPTQGQWLDTATPNLAKSLQNAGYYTAHFGKWHISASGNTDAPPPTQYGFHESSVWAGTGPQIKDTRPLPQAYLDALARGDDVTYDGIMTELAVDRSIDFISRAKGQPFFLNLWIKEGHAPYKPLPSHLTPYNNHPDEAERIYYASIGNADRQIGRLLAHLNQEGLRQNTIVIFTSDNGPEVPTMHNPYSKRYESRGSTGGLKGRKRSLFCGGVRVPFIVRWPGVVPAGKINTETVLSMVDLMPTLLSAAGVSAPPTSGENLLSAFQGVDTERTKSLYNSFYYTHDSDPVWYSKIDQKYIPHDWPQVSILSGDWKLVHSFKANSGNGRTELYNMRYDPFERRDKSTKSPGVAKRLMRELMGWWNALPNKPTE